MKKKNVKNSQIVFALFWVIFGLIALINKKDLGLAVTLFGISLMYASNYSILNIKD